MKSEITKFCPDYFEWPNRWQGVPKDIKYAEQIIAIFAPFIQSLILEKQTRKTIEKHIDNLWILGGELIQTGNKDNFLSLDFGLKEFGVVDSEERLKRYRRCVYEAGALGRSGKTGAGVIDNSVLKKEREKDFELKRIQRFRYRTRYFTDSGIIGTKEFVSGNYRRFKDIFMSKRDKIPKPVAGLDGIYSLKRLAES